MLRRLLQWGRVDVRYISAGALAVLMGLEAFSALPYRDIAGIWTNGYGNTHGVTARTPPVTPEQAQATLRDHTDKFGTAVQAALTRPVTQGQFDAYLLLAYNIGPEAFRTSSVARAHNRGDFYGACMYGMRWDKVTIDGELVRAKGLVNRRYTEYNLCVAGIPHAGAYVPRRK